jgi:hypothetical protein
MSAQQIFAIRMNALAAFLLGVSGVTADATAADAPAAASTATAAQVATAAVASAPVAGALVAGAKKASEPIVIGPVAGVSGPGDLVLAEGGRTTSVVVVRESAGQWEKRAALDLASYIERIADAKPRVASTPADVAAALANSNTVPTLIVGQAALDADPTLKTALQKASTAAKAAPLLRIDAVAIRRMGQRVYLAGSNDDSHYYAVSELLQRWGCRWYMPGEFGEHIPRHPRLAVGQLDYAYASPFEVRRYWLSWNGDTTGQQEFMRRNFFNEEVVPNGHNLAQFTKELIPPGKSMFNVPISEDRTADHVAGQLEKAFANGERIQLGMEDGIYQSDSAADRQLIALQYDKYFLTQSYTDAFMTFHNKTAQRLLAKHPNSRALIGFLIYSNITLPPVKDITAAKPLVGYFAPIDFDPIHGMDDPRSKPRRECRDIFHRWAKIMQGRLVIYDYDQGMLVWRDLPNPSHQAFRHDVQHYLKAGILGVDTESRGAMATTGLNLFLRGQLLWHPAIDVDGLIAEHYTSFYGPAAEPMAAYWNAIYRAWEETLATEHEYFLAPAIYTPELLATLRARLADANQRLAPLAGRGDAASKRFVERLRFVSLGFAVLENYMAMTRAAATDTDFSAAVAAGERGLAAREQLTAMNPTFTTYKTIGEHGYAWWPGEVKQYQELLPLVNGTKGQLVAKLPLVWNWRRDEKDVGVKENWFRQPIDLAAWNSLPKPIGPAARWALEGKWEQVSADLYLQAQGVLGSDYQSYTGHGWYQTDLELSGAQIAGPLRLKFPGIFNECWLYVNGEMVAHRPFQGVWWMNDYRFEWEVDVAGKFKAGKNSIVIRHHNPHHFGGMFRRPFLYRAVTP